MDISKLGIAWGDVGLVVLAGIGIHLAVVACTRLVGQRNLASLASFDFAVSVAVGSIVGRVVLVDTSLLAGVIGLGTLFATESLIALVRRRPSLERLVDRRPVLLVRDGTVLHDQLRRTRLDIGDLREQLRAHGLGRVADARAVVLERNGTVTVVHQDRVVDDEFFQDVTGWDPTDPPADADTTLGADRAGSHRR